jgi:hypothetical protein
MEEGSKNKMKKNTSEMINKIIPHRNPFVTIFVCKLTSVSTSLTVDGV